MERERGGEARRGRGAQGAERFERVLRAALGVLAAALVLGTVAAFLSGAPRAARARRAAEAHRATSSAELPRGAFMELGAVRATTGDPDEALVLASIAFSYDGSDAAFAEELEDKKARLRAAAVDYFSSKTREELAPAFEGLVKAELRERFDALLSLGSVGELWLPAFAVVD